MRLERLFTALLVASNIVWSGCTGQPPPNLIPQTAGVIITFNQAFESSLAKDAQWLAAHPE